MSEKSKLQLIAVEYSSLGLPADLSGFRAYAAADTEFYGVDFLRVNGKTGHKAYGVENTELPAGANLAALIGQIKFGFIDWEDGAIETQAWLGLTEVASLKALRQSLGKLDPTQWAERGLKGEPRDPFKLSARLPLLWLDRRKPLLFTTSSDRQVKAVKGLVNACNETAEDDPKITNGCVPVVEIGVDNYQHSLRTVGSIYFPVFEIVKWLSIAQVARVLIEGGFGAAFGISQHHTAAIAADPDAAGDRPQKTSIEKPRR